MQLEHSQKEASRKKAFFKHPPLPGSLETEHNKLRLGELLPQIDGPSPSSLSQLPCPLAAAAAKEKGSRGNSLCWAEPSPCLTSSTRNCPLHSVFPFSTASTTVISASPSMKLAELVPGNTGREIGSSTSSRRLNFLLPTAKGNPQTSECHARFLLQPGRFAQQPAALPSFLCSS